jgi:hypothetical protein
MAQSLDHTDLKQLNFYEAMYHFKKMFPKFDSDIIEIVLRSNNGSVDRTIDELLNMSMYNDDSDEFNGNLSRKKLEKSSLENRDSMHINFNDEPPSYNDYLASIHNENNTFYSLGSFQSIKTKPQIKLMKDLPNDFLKINLKQEDNFEKSNLITDYTSLPMRSQENDLHLQDEYLALMLQNEEFIQQLKVNQDLVNILDKEEINSNSNSNLNDYNQNNYDILAYPCLTNNEFKAKLTRMAKQSTHKFSKLAKIFMNFKKSKKLTYQQNDFLNKDRFIRYSNELDRYDNNYNENNSQYSSLQNDYDKNSIINREQNIYKSIRKFN